MKTETGLLQVEDRMAYQKHFLVAALSTTFLVMSIGWTLESRGLVLVALLMFAITVFHVVQGMDRRERMRKGQWWPGEALRPAMQIWFTFKILAVFSLILWMAWGQWQDPHIPLWFRPLLLVACNGCGVMVLAWMRTLMEFLQQRRHPAAMGHTL